MTAVGSRKADSYKSVLAAVGRAPEHGQETAGGVHSIQVSVRSSYGEAAVVQTFRAYWTGPKMAEMAATVGSSRTVADSALCAG